MLHIFSFKKIISTSIIYLLKSNLHYLVFIDLSFIVSCPNIKLDLIGHFLYLDHGYWILPWLILNIYYGQLKYYKKRYTVRKKTWLWIRIYSIPTILIIPDHTIIHGNVYNQNNILIKRKRSAHRLLM